MYGINIHISAPNSVFRKLDKGWMTGWVGGWVMNVLTKGHLKKKPRDTSAKL